MDHERGKAGEEDYTTWEQEALVLAFGEVDFADQPMGRELMVRTFKHAGLTVDPGTVPLIGRDGQQMRDKDGRLLTQIDYINFAVENSHQHPGHLLAVTSLLDFLFTSPGDPEYEKTKLEIVARSQAGQR